MYATLIAVAALWGAATGLLVPRAAYRLSVEPEERWRDSCPAGHALVGPAGGWLGTPACRTCATEAPSSSIQVPPPTAEAPPATEVQTQAPAPAPPSTVPRPLTGPPLTGPRFTAPLLTGLTCAALALAAGPRPELLVWLLYAPFAVLLATVDVRVHRLPDQLTLPLAAATPLLLAGAELLPYDGGSWLHALLGGSALGGGYFTLFLIHPNGMGFGDVKLALSLGAALGWYGWGILFAGTFAGFLLGSLYGLGLVVARRGTRTSAIPFGPFMLGGALLGLLLGALSATP
ncbi:prepilin peptidase [Streptomyces sp. ISL-36]|uniref:prepilin peptidase n=1 Tax=Streptomyces sp. ISL-36 TaxID=2819182 RepID=UPI001BE990E0|nr:A24 family peptidase [Streptomyces sp. ISL-36]MBT2439395.1 prepilin peptidase [Streptomyces sp. ISL-36]